MEKKKGVSGRVAVAKEGKKAPWVEARLEDIGQIKKHTWDELYNFAINYQLRDPRMPEYCESGTPGRRHADRQRSHVLDTCVFSLQLEFVLSCTCP